MPQVWRVSGVCWRCRAYECLDRSTVAISKAAFQFRRGQGRSNSSPFAVPGTLARHAQGVAQDHPADPEQIQVDRAHEGVGRFGALQGQPLFLNAVLHLLTRAVRLLVQTAAMAREVGHYIAGVAAPETGFQFAALTGWELKRSLGTVCHGKTFPRVGISN